jgi:hypothetical protein
MPLKGSKSPHSTSLANLSGQSRPPVPLRTYNLFFIGNHTHLTLPRQLLGELEGWYPGIQLLMTVRESQLIIRVAPKDHGNSRIRVFGTGFAAEIPEDVLTYLGWRQTEEITIKLDPQSGGLGLRASLVRQRGRRYQITVSRDEFIEFLTTRPSAPEVLRDQHIVECSLFNGRTWDLITDQLDCTLEVERGEGNHPVKHNGPPDMSHLHMSDPEFGITVPGNELEVDLKQLELDQQTIRNSTVEMCVTCPKFLNCAISRVCLQQRERARQEKV